MYAPDRLSAALQAVLKQPLLGTSSHINCSAYGQFPKMNEYTEISPNHEKHRKCCIFPHLRISAPR